MPKLEDLKKPQKLTVTHAADATFTAEGARKTSLYRDLQLTDATHGAVKAHIIKNVGHFDPNGANATEHAHICDFHFFYMLKGWIKLRIDGKEVTVREGSSVMMPGGTYHAVLDYSDDRELLEIFMPSDFGTVDKPAA